MNKTVTPLTSQKNKIRGGKEMSAQSRRFIALKDVAAQYKKEMLEQTSTNENDQGAEETGMTHLRKIDSISFLVYLLGFIVFNCYYWVNMLVF